MFLKPKKVNKEAHSSIDEFRVFVTTTKTTEKIRGVVKKSESGLSIITGSKKIVLSTDVYDAVLEKRTNYLEISMIDKLTGSKSLTLTTSKLDFINKLISFLVISTIPIFVLFASFSLFVLTSLQDTAVSVFNFLASMDTSLANDNINDMGLILFAISLLLTILSLPLTFAISRKLRGIYSKTDNSMSLINLFKDVGFKHLEDESVFFKYKDKNYSNNFSTRVAHWSLWGAFFIVAPVGGVINGASVVEIVRLIAGTGVQVGLLAAVFVLVFVLTILILYKPYKYFFMRWFLFKTSPDDSTDEKEQTEIYANEYMNSNFAGYNTKRAIIPFLLSFVLFFSFLIISSSARSNFEDKSSDILVNFNSQILEENYEASITLTCVRSGITKDALKDFYAGYGKLTSEYKDTFGNSYYYERYASNEKVAQNYTSTQDGSQKSITPDQTVFKILLSKQVDGELCIDWVQKVGYPNSSRFINITETSIGDLPESLNETPGYLKAIISDW